METLVMNTAMVIIDLLEIPGGFYDYNDHLRAGISNKVCERIVHGLGLLLLERPALSTDMG